MIADHRGAGPVRVSAESPPRARVEQHLHFRYLPTIGASSFLVSLGTFSGFVMMAVASASLHEHARGPEMRPTASAIARCAVFAFCSRLATMRSTVTES